MKKSGTACLISIVVFWIYFTTNVSCSSPWDDFLRRPDDDSLVMLRESIGPSAQRCSWGNPINQSIAPTAEQYVQLLDIIVSGNESAFRAALLVLKCLDGGNTEDFYRSGGMFFERNPRSFLEIINEMVVPESELKLLLTMLPLHVVDDIDLRISMVRNRVEILRGIKDAAFRVIRHKGLSFLDEEMESLNRIRRELK